MHYPSALGALLGVALVGGGLALAPLTRQPLHLYLTLGLLVSGGSLCLGYTGHALFLPNWFVRRRGLAFGIAFSGVGVGSIVLLPWVQRLIGQAGWRYACLALAVLVFAVLTPLNLLQRRRPEDLCLHADGESSASYAPSEEVKAGLRARHVNPNLRSSQPSYNRRWYEHPGQRDERRMLPSHRGPQVKARTEPRR